LKVCFSAGKLDFFQSATPLIQSDTLAAQAAIKYENSLLMHEIRSFLLVICFTGGRLVGWLESVGLI